MSKLNLVKLGLLTALAGATVTGCASSNITKVSQGAPITYKIGKGAAQYASLPSVPRSTRSFTPPSVSAPVVVTPRPQHVPQSLPNPSRVQGFDQASVDTDLYKHQKVGKTYTIMGKSYTPKHDPHYDVTGTASWYGDKFHGKPTATGETFNKNDLTAAHKTLPLNSILHVTNLENGKTLNVRLNDRGPFIGDRIIDLSEASADALGITSHGLGQVRVQYAGPADPMAASRSVLPSAPEAVPYPEDSYVEAPQEYSAPVPVAPAPVVPAPAPRIEPVVPAPIAPSAPQAVTPSEPEGEGEITLTIKGPIHVAGMNETATQPRLIRERMLLNRNLSILFTAACLMSAPIAVPLSAQAQISVSETTFATAAPHAAILDFETGEVLYEKNASRPMAPASMTKIMTAEMVFNALKSGRLTPETEFTVSEEAWRRGGAKSGSSTMFLDLNSTVSVENLIKGVIIQSGNDACIVLAEGMAGSEDAFAAQMTARAREMGLSSATFRNSTGWPHPEHNISAIDLAKLARAQIKNHPEYYPLYKETNFKWNGITQGNRNPLLGKFTGADGLKTGRTDVSGFGLVGSAERDGKRRIIVVNGLETSDERRDTSLALMNSAFNEFKVYALRDAGTELARAQVFMGQAEDVGLALAAPITKGLHISERGKISSRVEYKTAPAPIAKGDQLAELIVSIQGRQDMRFPLFATEDVKSKSAFGKAWAVLIGKIRGEL